MNNNTHKEEKKMGNIILIALYLIFTVSGVVLFKLGAGKGFEFSISTGVFNLKISLISILGLICYVCSFLMYMFLIAKYDMSYIVPVTTAIVQVATFVLAIVIFKESLTITKVIAIALIVLGVGIMNIK